MTLASNLKMVKKQEDFVLNNQDIQRLIPHRYPFLLIDSLIIKELGTYAVGIKNVSCNEWFFQGHFPDHPVMPGVLIIEAMAQSAGALVVKTLQAQSSYGQFKTPLVYFMSVEEAKFRKPVVPGDRLELHVEKLRSRGLIWKFKGRAFVNDVLTDEATFTAMVAGEIEKVED